jgi:hypothetical protein
VRIRFENIRYVYIYITETYNYNYYNSELYPMSCLLSKCNVSETVFCLLVQMGRTQLGQVEVSGCCCLNKRQGDR